MSDEAVQKRYKLRVMSVYEFKKFKSLGLAGGNFSHFAFSATKA